MDTPPALETYSHRTFDKLRYGDTDRQGHVNNAVFMTFLETGRVALLYDPVTPCLDPGCSFAVVRVHMDLLAEIHWPGTVEIGTRVSAIGRSSLTCRQAVFQNSVCAAAAEVVIVQVNNEARKSQPFSDELRRRLEALA